MASTTWVVRLLQDDKQRTPILLNVSQKEGGHDLNFDLLATDGEAAFTTKVRQRSLKKLRAKNFDASDDDWNNIVSSVLNPWIKLSASSQQQDNLDVTCSITGKEPKRVLAIAFINKVEEITQRLGTLELSETEDTDDVDLFGWASQAVGQRDGLRGQVSSLEGQTRTKDEVVASLQKQIDELVEAKADHEKQMLSKFALLLNEKKLKIRRMQRILSTAKVDPKKLEEMEAEIGDETVSAARRKKRPVDEDVEKEETEDSDTFETMEVDPTTEKEPDSPVSGNTTPTASEAEESDDDNLSGSAVHSDMPRRAMGAPAAQGKSSTRREAQLPKKPEPAPATNDDDEETASEDDEL